MKKLKPCKTCGKEVADSAFTKSCPHCGQAYPTSFNPDIGAGVIMWGFIILVLAVIFGGDSLFFGASSAPAATAPKIAAVKGAYLPADLNPAWEVRKVPRTSQTESEMEKCATVARQKGVELSSILRAGDMGEGMRRYSANGTYRGNSCQYTCLVWGGKMDSAACLRGATQDEIFCANPPCFR